MSVSALPSLRSVDGSLQSTIPVHNDIKSELETSLEPRKIYRNDKSGQFVTKELKDNDCQQSELCDTRFDWIESEMAKVCGEGSNYQEVFKFHSLSSPCHKEELKFIPPYEKCNENHTVVLDSFNQPSQPGKMDWKFLRRKHEAEMKRRLEKLDKEGNFQKKAKLERKFSELFGPDELAVDALNCKKKDDIAAITVKHLMPFYKTQRISSKDLFKKLAKHISESMMLEKCFPGN